MAGIPSAVSDPCPTERAYGVRPSSREDQEGQRAGDLKRSLPGSAVGEPEPDVDAGCDAQADRQRDVSLRQLARRDEGSRRGSTEAAHGKKGNHRYGTLHAIFDHDRHSIARGVRGGVGVARHVGFGAE